MKWLILALFMVSCGGKIVVPPPAEDEVNEEVDPGDTTGSGGSDTDVPVGDVDPGDTVGDGEGDDDVVVDDGDGDTVVCPEPEPEEKVCDEEHKSLVCHNGNEICVDDHSVDKHLEKGDELGKCE